ncbi:hypothetical protein BJX68DRAFT_264289 [Aspergillus pseudodeflectus]|uniref:SMP-30/Gluconolactonase/LRE-like region domain-containing protein n=1 Tax=Aspergillus pseudodeflectus TaxID=176178 RepID=A0ABR4KS78_9EURO
MRISTLIPLLSGVSVALGQYYEARKLTEIQPSNTRFTDLAFRGETGYILLTAVGGTVHQFDSFHQHGGPQTIASVVQQELAGIVELDTDRYGVTAWSQNGDAPTMSLYELDLTEPATAMWPIGSPNRTPVNIKLGGIAAINSHISFQVDTGAALRGINWADGTLFKDPYFDQIQPGTIGIAYRAPNLYVTDAQAGTLKRVKVNEVTGAVFPSTFETLVTSSFLKGCAGIALSHWNEDIFVTNPTLGAILRVNLQTKTVRFVSVNSIVKPVAAEFAPWGGLYVAAQGDNSVGSSVWSVKVPDEPAR